jgi:hypothetical protein
MHLLRHVRLTNYHTLLTATFAALASVTSPGCGDDGGAGSTGESGDDTSTGGVTTSGTTTSGTTDAESSSESGESTIGPTTGPTTTGPTTGETTGAGVFHLSGNLAYERVPFDYDQESLDYSGVEELPIRGVTVRLLDAASEEEIASAPVGDDGAYAFEYEGAAQVKLRIYAETTVPAIVVEDNTDGDAIYVLDSVAVDSAADATLDVVATTGWTGDAYGEARLAAPFAVLDAAYRSARRFLDETTPAPEFPPLLVNWSAENRPEDGDKADGQIGTSHWDREELYILGKQDIDTDEFDSYIIVHEWCHYFQSTISRSDSIGGSHGSGDINDPRVAWGEGACNAMSGMIHDPVPVYYDTTGLGQSEGFTIDFEVNATSADANPGWYEENTVASLVYDLYDGANEPFDQVEVGLQGVYDGMLALREAPSLTTVFPFVAAIKASQPAAVADIDTLTVHHQFDAAFGVSIIKDEWGADESHDAGIVDNLPVYTDAAVGDMLEAKLAGDAYNRLSQNRYYRIVGGGLPITVQSMCVADVDLKVYYYGEIVASAETGSGDEFLEFEAIDGETYILNVGGVSEEMVDYSAMIVIEN